MGAVPVPASERVAPADWGQDVVRPERGGGYGRAVAAALLLGAVAVLLSLLTTPLAGVGLLVVTLAAFAAWVPAQGRRALAAAGARPVEAGEAPRLENLVAGLSATLAIAPPRVLVVDDDRINAFVCDAGGAALAVTRAALTSLTRTELEALVAHCLVRIKAGAHKRASLAAAVGALVSPPQIGPVEDLRACAVTRYPPALVSLLRKATPVEGRLAPLWFAGSGPAHRSIEERVETLADL